MTPETLESWYHQKEKQQAPKLKLIISYVILSALPR